MDAKVIEMEDGKCIAFLKQADNYKFYLRVY